MIYDVVKLKGPVLEVMVGGNCPGTLTSNNFSKQCGTNERRITEQIDWEAYGCVLRSFPFFKA